MIDNLLVVDTLHSCFSHAIIDSAFPYFWSINDIKENESSDNPKNFQLFITKEMIIKFKKKNLQKIDSDLKKYKGVWHDIISLVSDNYILSGKPKDAKTQLAKINVKDSDGNTYVLTVHVKVGLYNESKLVGKQFGNLTRDFETELL